MPRTGGRGRSLQPPETKALFRGPRAATGATQEIKLTNEFKKDKGHGWLEKENKKRKLI